MARLKHFALSFLLALAVIGGTDPALSAALDTRTFGAKCDNATNDTAAIQKAINAAVGKSLLIQAGTCLINPQLFIPSNSDIRGEGIGRTILKQMNGSTGVIGGAILNNSIWATNHAQPTVADPAFIVENINSATLNTNIRIADLTLDGNKANNGGINPYGLNFAGTSYVTVERVRAINTRLQGIILNWSNFAQVLHSESDGTNSDGIQLAEATNYLVDGNKVTNAGDYCIEIGHGEFLGSAAFSTGNGTVSNNYVSGCVNYGIAARGKIWDIAVPPFVNNNPSNRPLVGVIIKGNHVTGALRGGIVLQEQIDKAVVDSNEAYGNGFGGIAAAPSAIGGIAKNVTIKNNLIRDNILHGMTLDSMVNSTVEGNIVVGNYGYGIRGSLGYSIIKGNNISGNNTSALFSFSGIALQYASHTLVEGNFISNDPVHSANAITELTSCSNMRYVNNYLGGKGIYAPGANSFISNPGTVYSVIVPVIKSAVPTAVTDPGTARNIAISGTHVYFQKSGQWYRAPVASR